MHAWPSGVNIGNRPLIEATMKGCQVREWIVGEKCMSFSRILYMICVNGGYLVSDIFNNIDRKSWREIKETLQRPPMKNQLVVYTQVAPPLADKSRHSTIQIPACNLYNWVKLG